ncbi:MAG: outer membrane protein [Saprospiraceae bacterium]|jgi:outer membrane protein
MKRLIKISLLAVAFLTLSMSSVFAQKYGHMNSGTVLTELPETKAADTELRAYQEQLIKKGKSMATAFEKDYTEFATLYQGGTVTPAVAQAKEEEFRKRQAELQQYEQKVAQDVSIKREELFTPILKKVQDAIDAVGKENGYTMIFDTSAIANNPIVFAAEADDVTEKVKTRLGI